MRREAFNPFVIVDCASLLFDDILGCSPAQTSWHCCDSHSEPRIVLFNCRWYNRVDTTVLSQSHSLNVSELASF
eukprot:8613878-Pyramimonas_sp.AAC.1